MKLLCVGLVDTHPEHCEKHMRLDSLVGGRVGLVLSSQRSTPETTHDMICLFMFPDYFLQLLNHEVILSEFKNELSSDFVKTTSTIYDTS